MKGQCKLKILLVNKFHYLKGGSEKYYFELAELLKERGHEVAFFSMRDKRNIRTNFKEYFVDEIDLNNGSKLKALEVIYSKKNRKEMEKALDDFKPDIVHLNNFQRQLSASIIDPIKKRNIPIVFTAHDVQAICPAITMLDSKNKVCERCIKGKYLNCIKGKCIKTSLLKSFLGAIEGYYYRIKNIYNKFDYIITPSEFYKKQFENDGIDSKKIMAIHNCIKTEEYNIELEDEGYALYLGRLSEEKGILNLIKAFSNLEYGTLHIAGEGPEKDKIEEIVKERNLSDRIILLGFLDKEQVKEEIRKCRFVVVPSMWYENCSYSILETLTIGKPVIGSRIGGIPELVKDNENGFTFMYNDIKELTEKMKILFENKKLAQQFGEKAKTESKFEFNSNKYIDEIEKIYEKILEGEN